jgi:hypothetical protein
VKRTATSRGMSRSIRNRKIGKIAESRSQGLHANWILGSQFPAHFVLALVVLVRFVDGDAAEIFRHFQQVLVAVVPIGADFAQKHRSLVGPA